MKELEKLKLIIAFALGMGVTITLMIVEDKILKNHPLKNQIHEQPRKNIQEIKR